jgi:hypothetical protein
LRHLPRRIDLSQLERQLTMAHHPGTGLKAFLAQAGQRPRFGVEFESQLVCRFSDAGGDEPSMRSGGRRLKSAEARNRGEVGHRRCRGLYGDLAAALGWGGWIKAPAPIGLLSQDGCG